MGSLGEHPMTMEAQHDFLFTQGMGSGANTGPFGGPDVFTGKSTSPSGMSVENNLNYKHVRGMNATNINCKSKLSKIFLALLLIIFCIFTRTFEHEQFAARKWRNVEHYCQFRHHWISICQAKDENSK